ncbi:hypothetical protein J437_LFUL002460 [Ladona fulva]|uniref:Uncharacterized protein n=1 Tax=Ladona fulva TaxID=123851 RepID=A0A8K0KQ57_LADFU|nr:hypothetical protein J437_LFUL002460 [Ladona fulva]
MLKQFVYPQIQDLQPNIIFQQDGALPLHWSTAVCKFLDTQYPNGWIGRRGPIAWPRSPDITLLDFFWGFVKDQVYVTKADDIPMLRCHITDATAKVTGHVTKNMASNTDSIFFVLQMVHI